MSTLARRTPTAIAYAAVVLLGAVGPWPVFVIVLLAFFIIGLVDLARLSAWRPLPTLGGALYLGLGLGALGALWANTHPWLLAVLLATWAADTVAYLVGSQIGRHHLAPRISPGKTWEGSIAGFAAAAGVIAAVGMAGPAGIVVAVGIGPVGLAGDLFESWLKRRAQVKDSGALLPGHGGVLDRIDSLLFVGPFVWVVVAVLGRPDGMMGR